MSIVNPDSRWFVVLDNEDTCIAKYDTNAPVKIPVKDFDVVELDEQAALDSYEYDDQQGYQT